MSVYKDKKTNKWYCIFRFTDWTGERKQVKKSGFDYKRQALDYERNYIEQKSNTTGIKFKNLYASYLEDCKHRLKATTLKRKKCIFRVHILPYFGDIPINEIKPSHIRAWQNEMLKTIENASTQRSVNAEFNAILNFATKYYNLQVNPTKQCDKIGSFKPKTLHFWTKEQFESFIPLVEDIGFKLMFNLLFYTGLRIGELLALTSEDIDLDTNVLTVNKSYYRLEKEDYITAPKTEKSNRSISLPQWLCDDTKTYINRLYGYNPQDRLFPFKRDRVYQTFKRLQEKTDLPPIRLHDLRHSHASLLIELGFSAVVIRDRLGHKSINTTINVYGHLYPSKQIEIAQALEKI